MLLAFPHHDAKCAAHYPRSVVVEIPVSGILKQTGAKRESRRERSVNVYFRMWLREALALLGAARNKCLSDWNYRTSKRCSSCGAAVSSVLLVDSGVAFVLGVDEVGLQPPERAVAIPMNIQFCCQRKIFKVVGKKTPTELYLANFGMIGRAGSHVHWPNKYYFYTTIWHLQAALISVFIFLPKEKPVMMKQIIPLLLSILFANDILAQAPTTMIHEFMVNNSTGTPVASRTIAVRASILQGSSSGTAVYVETHTPTTDANALARISVGAGTVVSGTYGTIDWSAGPYYIKTEVDIAGGSNFGLSNTTQMLSVPFALRAKTAESLSGGSSGGFTHYIGEEYLGGVVFHLWKDNAGTEHGLVVNLNNQSTSQAWSNVTGTEIGSTAQSSWDGLSNSNAIRNQSGHSSSAAKLCHDLNGGGTPGWYLPSIDELSLLWHNRFNVNKTLSGLGGAARVLSTAAVFWSSSEYLAPYAWNFTFNSGSANYSLKSNPIYVRAVRAF